MTALAADVAVAADLINRAEIDNWPRLTEELMHTPPRIHERNSERLQELVDWLAPSTYTQPSMVQAAVANFARVLIDLLLVVDYDLNVETPLYQVSKWYQREPRSTQAVEEWDVHVTLIHNLTVELTRALNLVVARTQQADGDALANQQLAVCEVSSGPARLQPVTYTPQQSEKAQPYPSLAGLPAVIENRTVGHLGFREGTVKRTPAEFHRWIALLVERRGKGSEPPPPGTPPFSLPKSARARITDSIPVSMGIFLAVLTAFAAFGGVIAHPWLVGSAIAAGLSAVALQRYVWKWPPNRLALLLAATLTVIGGVAGEFVSAAFDGGGKPAVKAVRQPSKRPSASASFRPVGQLEQGDFFRGGVGTVTEFKDPVSVPVGRELRLGIRLRNGGPDELPEATVKVTVPNVAASSESVGATVRSEAANPSEVADTVTVSFNAGQSACLQYVSGSTQFLDSRHGVIRSLKDTVISSGVAVGPIGVLSTETRYVVFSVRAIPLASGSRCGQVERVQAGKTG